MRFRRTRCRPYVRKANGFTLVEVLASLVFMAIVIPAAVQGLRIASMAGQMGERKAVAARIADTVLNELIVTGQWQTGSQTGDVEEGAIEYRWRIQLEPWYQQNLLRLLTVEVAFPVQGREYNVRLSTVIDTAFQ